MQKFYFRQSVHTTKYHPVTGEFQALLYPKPEGLSQVTAETVDGTVSTLDSTVQFNNSAGVSAQTLYVSNNTAAITISGDVTFTFWASVSDAAANACITAELIYLSNDYTVLGTIATATRNQTALTTTPTKYTWTVTPTETTLGSTDRLAVRVYIDDADSVTMQAGHTVTVYFGSKTADVVGDSYIQLTEKAIPSVTALTNDGAVCFIDTF